jgi:hypothetical protein
MDGQRFDQLARSRAKGASRRRVLKGLVGGAVGGICLGLRANSARAQCMWTGTFQTTFGGITMTLTETGGQVSGSYTFSDNGVPSSGTISGVVRTEFPGETILEGYWREAIEGGRLWFSMPLDSCAHFTGWYSSTDFAEEWISGWDGVRTGGGAPGVGSGDADATYFSNPGDSRAATYTMDEQTGTLFGPKDADGGVAYIDQAWIDSPDGDPQKRVFLAFDAAGTPMRAALASGETMSFEWASPSRVIITYQSADGAQEVQFPYEPGAVAAHDMAGEALTAGTRAHATGDTGRLAYTGLADPAQALTASRLAPAAQSQLGNPGIVEVRCGAGDLIGGATVTGSMAPANMPGTALDVSFNETSPGRYAYTLPIAPAPAPLEGFHRTRFERALNLICFGNLAILLTQVSKDYICAFLLGVPAAGTAGFVACEGILTAYVWMCRLNTARVVTGAAVDFFAGSFDVTARAQHPKLGMGQTRINASAGSAIPLGVITLAGAAGIENITTNPPDPVPQQGYTIIASTVCVPAGTVLTMQVVGTDNYAPAPTVVTLSETVTEGSLYVPGAEQGIQDRITVSLSGAVADSKVKDIVF